TAEGNEAVCNLTSKYPFIRYITVSRARRTVRHDSPIRGRAILAVPKLPDCIRQGDDHSRGQ
ncbi:MAG: hypothetical protein LUE95_02600, partial [Oscillospiraceae bacterium]|nr:hypothetical protein [Oscillospiraceae bacterium]